MTKKLENGELKRVHIMINTDDWELVKTLARAAVKDGKLTPSELVRELLSSALRGLRSGQIVAYDRILARELDIASKHLARASRRINIPKQGKTLVLP